MDDLFLIEPSKEYQKSFQSYTLAYRKINDNHYFNKYRKALENFDEFLNDLYNYYKGLDLPEGKVPFSTFWLVHIDEVVGVVRIRHKETEETGHIGYDISPVHRNKGYGTQILKLAMKKAFEMGIEDAILTCSIDNIASRRIIENNNGVLLGTFFAKEKNEHMYKFSIQTISKWI
jgi:predicted acetyltransferase